MKWLPQAITRPCLEVTQYHDFCTRSAPEEWKDLDAVPEKESKLWRRGAGAGAHKPNMNEYTPKYTPFNRGITHSAETLSCGEI